MSLDRSKSTTPKFNGSLLGKARIAYKHTIEDVSSFTKISASSLTLFENNEKTPTPLQIQKLSRLYSIGATSFFSETEPEFLSNLVDFRDANPKVRGVVPEVLLATNIASETSEVLSDLTSYFELKLNTLSGHYADDFDELTSENFISGVRKAIGFDLKEISDLLEAGKRPLASFLFRAALESSGISISFSKFNLEDFTGFVVGEDKVSRVTVNTAKHKNSYEFTLAHELAHVLLRKPGLSDFFDARNKTERSCNKFAAKFLAPKKLVRKIYNANLSLNQNINNLHKGTLLSRHAAAIRLRACRKITQSDLESWLSDYEPSESTGGYNPNNYHQIQGHSFTKLNKAGLLATSLVQQALDRDAISRFEASQILGFNADHLPEVNRVTSQRFEDIENILGSKAIKKIKLSEPKGE